MRCSGSACLWLVSALCALPDCALVCLSSAWLSELRFASAHCVVRSVAAADGQPESKQTSSSSSGESKGDAKSDSATAASKGSSAAAGTAGKSGSGVRTFTVAGSGSVRKAVPAAAAPAKTASYVPASQLQQPPQPETVSELSIPLALLSACCEPLFVKGAMPAEVWDEVSFRAYSAFVCLSCSPVRSSCSIHAIPPSTPRCCSCCIYRPSFRVVSVRQSKFGRKQAPWTVGRGVSSDGYHCNYNNQGAKEVRPACHSDLPFWPCFCCCCSLPCRHRVLLDIACARPAHCLSLLRHAAAVRPPLHG